MSLPVPTGNVYDKYGTKHALERGLVRAFFQNLEVALPADTPAVVLEVGVGEGEVSGIVRKRYPRAFICGLDLPDPQLAREWGTRALAGLFGDATSLPFRKKSVDLVVATEVLEHVPDPEAVLREMVRVAARTLILSVPREPIWRVGNILRRRYLRDWGNTPGHLHHWSRRGFVRFVSRQAHVEQVYSPLPWTLVVAAPRADTAVAG